MWTVEETMPGLVLWYLYAVDRCLVSEETFNTFKQNSSYASIVGMGNDWQAGVWYNNIKENFPSIFNRLDEFRHNDSVGQPAMWDSGDNGFISPSTLRYLHTLCDIKTHFGSMDNKNIVEIGVGYGGLCYMLHTYYKLENYHMVDLDNVMLLVRKYLNQLKFNKSISFEAPHTVLTQHPVMKVHVWDNKTEEIIAYSDEVEYDLAISEFCLSEMDDDGIDEYYKKYLLPSKQIYLLMNLHDKTRKSRCINKIEKDFNIEVLDEFPDTKDNPYGWDAYPNYVIVGEKK